MKEEGGGGEERDRRAKERMKEESYRLRGENERGGTYV